MEKTINCSDCQTGFVFSDREQEFYASKGFAEPRRCKPCRDHRKAGNVTNNDNFGNRAPQVNRPSQGGRVTFTGVCAVCGVDARVPFDPRGKPIFCRAHYNR